jgi:hypothetical protein
VAYRIPLPNGRYQLRLHFAETYPPNKRPGARRITVKVQGKEWKDPLDLFVMAGGFAKALILPQKDVAVEDGMLNIELINDAGISGIEIVKGRGKI